MLGGLFRSSRHAVSPSDRRLPARIVRQGRRLTVVDDSTLRRMGEDLRGMRDPDIRTLTHACALIRESARRVLGFMHHDVQLLAGIALFRGCVAEMATGEGKTLVTTLPAALHAWAGRGVHVMTVNPYLAQRDFQLMGPVYERLGLSVALLASGDDSVAKGRAYGADITYGVGSEFGFDYLRDQLGLINRPPQPGGSRLRRHLRGDAVDETSGVQRGLAVAIVDEADSLLIDEAGSALVLSGSSGRPSPNPGIYRRAAEIAAVLEQDRDVVVDRRRRVAVLTEEGLQSAFRLSGRHLPGGLMRPWSEYLEQALKARFLLQRDVEYVVQDDKVQIVDEFTGRRFEDRSWSNGLHQAVEAKEGAPITEESQTRVKISRQRFFGLYGFLCGMSGTALDCAEEFREFFSLPVRCIPLHRRSRRRLLKPRFFADMDSKRRAIVEEIAHWHGRRRPVLVGTRTILESRVLSELLEARGIEHRVLNAIQDAAEADIISRGGQKESVTIATNMAGRGSDIPLADGVARLGGLFVIASEMHESARVDRQLIGRAARQGEPGGGRFYVSAQDALLRDHSPRLEEILAASPRRADGSLRQDFSSEIEALQRTIERQRFDQRRDLLRRDRWMEKVLEHAS
jgi:preprotein translocase subunit SecA